MPALDSYILFTNGRCAEAMQFYERTLGGKLDALMRYADAPAPTGCSTDANDLVMHSRLLLEGRSLMASDVPPGMPAPADPAHTRSTGEATQRALLRGPAGTRRRLRRPPRAA